MIQIVRSDYLILPENSLKQNVIAETQEDDPEKFARILEEEKEKLKGGNL